MMTHGQMFWKRHYQFKQTTKTKKNKKKGIYNVKVTILKIQLGWFKSFLKLVFFVKLKDMLL